MGYNSFFTDNEGQFDNPVIEPREENDGDNDKENKNNENENENKQELDKVQETDLDLDVLSALGDDPTKNSEENVTLHSSVSKRWKHWLLNGITDDEREALLKKYPAPMDFEPPKLNPEVSAFLLEAATKRDEYFVERQKLATSALAALGSAMNDVITDNEGVDKADFVQKLNDAAKLINHMIYCQTESRKSFILPGVEKLNKQILSSSKTDEFLFGKNLKDRINEAKSIQKVGQSMKQSMTVTKPLQSRNDLNWRSQARRPAPARLGQGNQPVNQRPKIFFKNKQMPYNSRVQHQNRYKPRFQQGKFK